MGKGTTPEGKVKQKVDKLLQEYGVYIFKPVQFGYGPAGLDYHCVFRAGTLPIAFFVEAKDEGEWLTPRQQDLTKNLNLNYNAKVFIVEGGPTEEKDLGRLRTWLEKMKQYNLIHAQKKEALSQTTTSPSNED